MTLFGGVVIAAITGGILTAVFVIPREIAKAKRAKTLKKQILEFPENPTDAQVRDFLKGLGVSEQELDKKRENK
jgi:hypothetical protein